MKIFFIDPHKATIKLIFNLHCNTQLKEPIKIFYELVFERFSIECEVFNKDLMKNTLSLLYFQVFLIVC